MTEHQEPSPTNEELFRDAKVFTSLEESATWEDPFGSDEEHELFLSWLYDQRHRCANCTLWPNGLPSQSHQTEDAAVGEWPREGVVPMTEERRSWAATGDGPSPTNEELERRAKPFHSLEQYVTWEDPFESDEEHEAFLADLYESRRESR